jgi:hypothetical protein
VRRAVLLVLAAVAALAVLVGVGRWERGHRADSQSAGMRRVLDEIGGLDNRSLAAYRYLQYFQCLDYRRGGNPFALEVCADTQGRVIEAIDRRSGSPKIWSLRDDPGRSTVRVDRASFDRLLHRMGVPWVYLPTKPQPRP